MDLWNFYILFSKKYERWVLKFHLTKYIENSLLIKVHHVAALTSVREESPDTRSDLSE